MFRLFLREFGHFIYTHTKKTITQVLIFFVRFIQEQQEELKHYYLQQTQDP